MKRSSIVRSCALLISVGWLATFFVPSIVVAEEVQTVPAADAEKGADGGWLRTITGLDEENIEAPLRALALVTIFGVVPSIVLLTTCFPRILIVLLFLRRALGAQDLPPNMIVFGLSLLLTGVVMMPLWRQVYDEAYVPFVEKKEISTEEAYARAEAPIKRFLLSRTRIKELRLMVEASESRETPKVAAADVRDADGTTLSADVAEASWKNRQVEDLSFFTILPAFVLSELKLAFTMGFMILLPFLVIDLVVSAVLVSMGMIMLPPALVSLPLKILVFVLVDGWNVVVEGLLKGIQG